MSQSILQAPIHVYSKQLIHLIKESTNQSNNMKTMEVYPTFAVQEE